MAVPSLFSVLPMPIDRRLNREIMLIKKNAVSAALLTLAVGVMSVSAQAADVNSASASISDFSYQLIDLNPTDGIAASLTFTSFSSTSRSASAYRGGGTDTLSGLGSTRFQGVDGVASTAVTQFGVASEARATMPEVAYNLFSSETNYVQRFTLSADTLVIFSGRANLNSSNLPGSGSYIQARTALTGSVIGSRWPHIPGFSNSVQTYRAGTDNLLLLGSMQSFGEAMFGEVGMSTSTSAALSYITPVPEPETYAMLFAGLGLVAGALRRKRRSAR